MKVIDILRVCQPQDDICFQFIGKEKDIHSGARSLSGAVSTFLSFPEDRMLEAEVLGLSADVYDLVVLISIDDRPDGLAGGGRRAGMHGCLENCLNCAASFSEPAPAGDGADILHCTERDGHIVQEDHWCRKWCR